MIFSLISKWIFLILGGIDAGIDITDYVQCKIRSLCAQGDEDEIDGKNKTKT